MKICIYSDVHWCQNSSVVRSRGSKYSTRLENLIQSLNWAEQLAWETHSDCIVCCGDFFDASVLNSEEISALQEVNWAPISHLFLTGNHETNVSSLEFSTTDLFKLCPNVCVVNTPQQYFIDNQRTELCFLPYVLERDRKMITEYFGKATSNRIIFSHNDLKDVQYGAFLSTEGFQVKDIEDNCNLYFNGHIHNCCNVTSKIINVGNLTGQNFTEDAVKYSHCAIVLDTETLEYKFYSNPFSLKFYKIDLTSCLSVQDIQSHLNVLNYNAVATINVTEDYVTETRNLLEQLKQTHICEYRLTVQRANTNGPTIEVSKNTTDHLKQFESYVLTELGNTDIVREELQYIMR